VMVFCCVAYARQRLYEKAPTISAQGFSCNWEPGNVLLSQEGGSGAFRSTASATGTVRALRVPGNPLRDG
jgi:hypothetical protein